MNTQRLSAEFLSLGQKNYPKLSKKSDSLKRLFLACVLY